MGFPVLVGSSLGLIVVGNLSLNIRGPSLNIRGLSLNISEEEKKQKSEFLGQKEEKAGYF